MSIGKRIPW